MAPGTDTWQQASDYLTWIGGGTLLLASNLAVPYLLRNDGRPRLAMVLVSGGALLNILLNYIMVGRLGLGLTGTAQATSRRPWSACSAWGTSSPATPGCG
jgi:Na+-driven multidrug efflux pump